MVEIANIDGISRYVRNIEQLGIPRYVRNIEHAEATPFYRAVDGPSLGRAISETRKEVGLTQQELAGRLKVTRGTIVRLERGEAVSLVVAMNAIRTLGRDVALVPRFSKLQIRP